MSEYLKIIKILNNNAVVCTDNKNTEKIVMGRGLAFQQKVGSYVDNNRIEKIFTLHNRETSNHFQQIIQDIPVEHILLAEQIISQAKSSLKKELHDSNIFEIGNHTYKMHAFSPRYGIKQKLYESDDEYAKALKDDVSKLEYKFMVECGFRTEVFAYPFGRYSTLSEKVLRELGFKAFLTCNEGVNKLKKGDAKALSHLKRVNRSGNLTTYQFFQKLKSF